MKIIKELILNTKNRDKLSKNSNVRQFLKLGEWYYVIGNTGMLYRIPISSVIDVVYEEVSAYIPERL